MSESKETEPGCGWIIVFGILMFTLAMMSSSLTRIATAVERIAAAAQEKGK